MFEEVMVATAKDENNEQNTDDVSSSSVDDSNDNNGDLNELCDYLDSDSSSLSGLGVEATEWNSVSSVAEYLDGEKNQEYRAMFDTNGNLITAAEAKKIINQDQFKAIIFNPEKDFTKEELHELANKLIENKQQNAVKAGEKVNAIYAVHQRADGTNGHVHIVFHEKTKAALKAAKVDYKEMNKTEIKEWIVERSSIVDSVRAISEAEKIRNIERLSSLEGLKRETGTEKRDAIIERYMGKSEHNSGNFSLVQAEKSFNFSVQKGRMSEKHKNQFIKEIEGRLNSLTKAELAQKIGSKNWNIDREKWLEFQNELKEQKVQTVASKVQKTIVEKSQKDLKDYSQLVPVNLPDIDKIMKEHFSPNKSSNKAQEIFIENKTTKNKPTVAKQESHNQSVQHVQPIEKTTAKKEIVNLNSFIGLNRFNSHIGTSSFDSAGGKNPLDEFEIERKKLMRKLEQKY
ncbi:MAG: hypothetical protein WC141_05175 [Arcobacteraceae bacterium]